MSNESKFAANDSNNKQIAFQTKKKEALKSTIRKIVRANKDFHDRSSRAKITSFDETAHKQPLEYFPKEIAIYDVKAGFEYSTTITIQNIINQRIKINFRSPKSPNLIVTGQSTYSLIPGFSQTVQIKYIAKDDGEFVDFLTLLCEDLTFEIPIKIMGVKGRLIVDPKVDLGYVLPETHLSFNVKVENPSSIPVQVECNGAVEDISLGSENFPMQLAPGESKVASYAITINKPGVYKGPLTFTILNQPEVYVTEFSVVVTAFNSFIVDETGNELNSLNFGEVLIGAEAVRELTILNNAPVPVSFKIVTNSGSKTDPYQGSQLLRTPYEAGVELAQKVFFLDTNEGEIPEFNYKRIKIRFKKKLEVAHQNLVSKFAQSESSESQQLIMRQSKEGFDSCINCVFGNGVSKKEIAIKAIARIPLITMTKQMLFFGEHFVGEGAQEVISLSSYMTEMPLKLEISQLYFVHCTPTQMILQPNHTKSVHMMFTPKSLGTFEGELRFVINGLFNLKVMVFGSGKMAVKNGENRASRSQQAENHQNPLNLTMPSFRISKQDLKLNTARATGYNVVNNDPMNLTLQSARQTQAGFTLNAGFSKPSENSKIKRGLSQRILESAQTVKQNNVTNYGQFTHRNIAPSESKLFDKNEPVPTPPPYNATVYLVKPLKKGIPKQLKPITNRFESNPLQFFREFPSTVQTHEETAQINERLNSDKLMRIHAGPTELYFGRIFAGSTASLNFHVKNDLWIPIQVLLDTSTVREVKSIPGHHQIIPSSETGSFKICLQTKIPRTISEVIKYTINNSANFYFAIQAVIVNPELDISRQLINFAFREESTEVIQTQSVILKNTGNMSVEFHLRPSRTNTPFRAYPMEGVVHQNEQLEVQFKYCPSNTHDDESFKVVVNEGIESREIRCVGSVNEVSCELVGNSLNFGNMGLDQRKIMHFIIKNTHVKNNCIFKIDEESLPDGVDIRPRFGKICTDESQKFEVELWAKRKIELTRHEVYIIVRGLPPMKVFLSSCVLTPSVELDPLEFNFGSVVIGNKARMTFEMANKSLIQAEVHLSLQTADANLMEIYSLIDVSAVTKTPGDSLIMEKLESADMERLIQAQPQSSKQTSKKIAQIDKIPKHKKTGQVKQEDNSCQNLFIFHLKPSKSYLFNLDFSPTKPIMYNFDLVFVLQGQERQKSIIRRVTCKATNPRFLFDPMSGIIDFGRQIMLGNEPSEKTIRKTFTIINTNATQKLAWNFDKFAVEQQTVFKIEPISGVIDEECSIFVTIDYKPTKIMVCETSIPIYFDNQIAQGFEMKLRGEATPPKVILSTEELILPITPLGVPSFALLSVQNDGYQNSNFTLYVPPEYTKIGLTATFVGNNMLGITNNKMIIKAIFQSNVPTSFTAKIAIEDDLKHTFYFSISGSTDNSLLTYAPFLRLGYFVNTMFRKGLGEFEDPMKYDPMFARNNRVTFDDATRTIKLIFPENKHATNSILSIHKDDAVSALKEGYDNNPKDEVQIAYEYYKQLSQTIKSWLFEYGVTSVSEFPEDIVNNDGGPFYDFLDLLVKSTLDRPRPDPNYKQKEKIGYLVECYTKLLETMKENNALINTVKPHFLLGYKDLLEYFKMRAESHVLEEYYEVSESQYKLLSIQNWTTLFLQALKIFCVSRLTLKDLKTAIVPLADQLKIEKVFKDDAIQMAITNSPTNFAESLNKDMIRGIKDDKKSSKIDKSRSQDIKVSTRRMSANKQLRSTFKDSTLPKSDLNNQGILQSDRNLEAVPQFVYENCPLYSVSEAVLLRWIELCHFAFTQTITRVTNFGSDLSNCYLMACAVDAYIEKGFHVTSQLTPNASISDDILNNFRLFKTCCIDFGVKDEFVENDHLKDSPIAMLLLTYHLFKALPSYFPKTTVEFNCALHEKATKEISLYNSTNKPMMYTIKMFGSKAFEIEQDVVRVEPKSTCLVPVSFFANTSMSENGRVFFQNRKNGKSVSGALVFNLKATIVNKFSMRVFKVNNISLYDMGLVEIVVQNPFPKDADFKIRLENVVQLIDSNTNKSNGFRSKRGRSNPVFNKKRHNEDSADENRIKDFLPSFFLKQERLWIRKGGEAKIYLQYLPITWETHKALINFQDLKVGEMQYEVIGTPKLPPPMADFNKSISVEEFAFLELEIPLYNVMLIGALDKLADRVKENREVGLEQTIQRLQRNYERDYEVELDVNEFFSQPTPISLGNRSFGLDQSLQKITQSQQTPLNNSRTQNAASQSPTKTDISDNKTEPNFKYILMPLRKVPIKDLVLTLILKGKQKVDHRVYTVQLSVLPKKIRAMIEIKTTARVPVIQHIPVNNNTDVDCTIRPSFDSIANSANFECSMNPFTIKKKSVYRYPLKFYSSWMVQAEGVLGFFNLMTNESFEYQIKAECEEPLSEDHLQFYAKAKSRSEITIRVKNAISEVKYFNVTCDIVGATIEKRVHFDETNFMDYKISFVPLVGGTLLHSLTFTDDMGRYFWYLLTLIIDSPESMNSISVMTEVRKPIAGKIEMENPTDVLAKFKAQICGDYLSGDPEFEIEANSKAEYLFFYFPVKVENIRRKIGFVAEDKSETWFDIECRAEEPRVIKLPIMKTEIGKTTAQQLSFMNPLKKKSVIVRTELSEKSNFKVNPRFFEIKPNDSVSVELLYTPRDLNKMESENLRFVSREIGNWNYQAFGIGVMPTESESILITTTIKTSVTHTVTWKNPFMSKIPVKLSLEGSSAAQSVLEIMSPKQSEILMAPMGNCHITIRFESDKIATYNCQLVLKTSDVLQWTYPIKAVAEAIPNKTEYVVKAKCEVESETIHHFHVIGMSMNGLEETFEHNLKIDHPDAVNIEKWLKIKTVKNRVSKPEEPLSYCFTFLPHKPLRAQLEFVLSGHSGGRWRFKMLLVSAEPDYFDTLTIVSQLGLTRSVKFRLFNSDKKNSNPFVARFEDETQSEFAVTPTRGMLEPKINDGNMFEVSFCPNKYGKIQLAVLIIETDQHYFRFLIKGMFEKYVPPK